MAEVIHKYAAPTVAIKSGKSVTALSNIRGNKIILKTGFKQSDHTALIDTDKWLSNIDDATIEDLMCRICQKKCKTGEYLSPPQSC